MQDTPQPTDVSPVTTDRAVFSSSGNDLTEGKKPCTDTPELSSAYVSLKGRLFAAYQELLADKDNYIPVVRKVRNGDVNLRQDKIGSKFFSNLLKGHFGGCEVYNCQTCREAFTALYPIWFMTRTGEAVSPMVNLAKELGIEIPVLRGASLVKSGGYTRIEYDLVCSMSIAVARDKWGIVPGGEEGAMWSHYHGFTIEQVQWFNDQCAPISANVQKLAATVNAVRNGLDPEVLRVHMKNLTGGDDALGGLTHIKQFSEMLGEFKSQEAFHLWIASKLRDKEWATLAHFPSSTAGLVFSQTLEGSDMQDVVDKYLMAVDPKNYRQRSSKAAAGLIKQVKDCLIEIDAINCLARTVGIVGVDIPAHWQSTHVVAQKEQVVQDAQTQEAVPVNANVLSAIDSLLAKREEYSKRTEEQAAAQTTGDKLREANECAFKDTAERTSRVNNSASLNRLNVRMISVDGFAEMLRNKLPARVALCRSETSVSQIFVATTEVEDAPGCKELFNFEIIAPSLRDNRSVSAISSVTPQNRAHLFDACGMHAHMDYAEIASIAMFGSVPLIVPFESHKLVSRMYDMKVKRATLLGGELKSKYIGLSAGINQISEEIGLVPWPQEHEKTNSVAAGLWFSMNDVFVVLHRNGEVETYQIASIS